MLVSNTSKDEIMNKEMSAEQLLTILGDLESIGAKTWLDGGWGVDALLGEQTRTHKDADFFIEKKEMDSVISYFKNKGHAYLPEGDMWWHFHMPSDTTEVDIFVIEFDEMGGGIYGPPENGAIFPADAFFGVGAVNGQEVRCLSPEYRVLCLTQAYGVVAKNGYQITVKDAEDMIKLCHKFNIEIPQDYTDRLKREESTT